MRWNEYYGEVYVRLGAVEWFEYFKKENIDPFVINIFVSWAKKSPENDGRWDRALEKCFGITTLCLVAAFCEISKLQVISSALVALNEPK